MKKTPLAKLIEKLGERKNALLSTDGEKFMFDYCIATSTKLLQEERQNLIEAYETVQCREDGTLLEDGDEYFKNTYEQ